MSELFVLITTLRIGGSDESALRLVPVAKYLLVVRGKGLVWVVPSGPMGHSKG